MCEVDNLTCDHCRFHGSQCKCIDHRLVHFSRPWFSCDVMTGKHTICSAFEPVTYYPALVREWHEVGGFDRWHKLWIDQWHHGRIPFQTCALILAKRPKPGREFSDDRYYVSYQDFVDCNIMRPDGIHYLDYAHIEQSRKSPIGYIWKHDGPGILRYEDMKEDDATT